MPHPATNELRQIVLDGHQMAYAVSGDSALPPLILVHGWGSHHGVWRETVEAVRSDYCCVAVNLLGFGESDKPHNADYSIQAQGQRMLRLINELGFDRFTVIGHSMGGQIALYMAAMLAPERVVRVVSVAGVVAGRLMPFVERVTYCQIRLGKAFPRLYSLARRLTQYRWYAHFQYRSWFYDLDCIPFNQWKLDRDLALQPGSHNSHYGAWQAIHNLDLTAHLPQITAPTLAIFGKQDGTVPVSDGYLVRDHVPDSRLVLIDPCGHFPMYEQPRQYLDALRQFLDN